MTRATFAAVQLDDFIANSDVDAWDIALVVIVIIASWLMARIARRGVRRLCARVSGISADLAATAASVVHGFVLLLGVGVALSILGAPIQPLLTAAIIVAVVAALALRGIADNFAAGIVLQTRRPIHIGDEIDSLGHDGVITEMNGRAVVIETWDGLRVHLPNAAMLDNPIVNLSERGARRSEIQVRCATTSTSADEIIDAVVAAVSHVSGVRDDPKPAVYVNAVDFERVTLLVQFWHESFTSSIVRSDVTRSVSAALRPFDDQLTIIGPPPPPPSTPPPPR